MVCCPEEIMDHGGLDVCEAAIHVCEQGLQDCWLHTLYSTLR